MTIIQPTTEQTRRVLRNRTYSGPGFGPRSFECAVIGLSLGLGLGSLASGGALRDYDFAAAGADFWIDASRPASYVASGGTITAIKSLISGTSLATIVGAPKVLTDPRDNRPSFYGSGADAVYGLDAIMAAAATGTNRAFTSISVFQVAACSSSGYFFTCNLSSGTHGIYFGQVSPGIRCAQAGPGGFISATSENAIAGLLVVTQRSPDGLTVFTSVNGGAETSVTVASHGLMSPDRTGIFTTCGLTPGTRFTGHLREQAFFGSDKGAAATAAMSAALRNKWRRAPQVQFIGDSLTAATLVNNGGLIGLLMARARADGLNMDPNGPNAMANGSGGAVWTPYRHSAASGNTCGDMLARVQLASTGLGMGGGSSGFYRNAQLIFLLAGTNGLDLTAYETLLTDIGTRQVQTGQTNWAVAVTTVPEQDANPSGVAAFNAGLAAKWNAFDATFGAGRTKRWDAYGCNGARSDGTHWTDAGYVTVVDHPTLGAYQAIKPFLQSVQ